MLSHVYESVKMADRFKLCCVLMGHEKDVRGVTAAHFPEGAIISGSRDVTSRVWVPNEYVYTLFCNQITQLFLPGL